MFIRLVQKELLHHLLDFRSLVVFALCVLLSVLGVYAGIQNHLEQLEQHRVVSERNQEAIKASLKEGRLQDLYKAGGYRWNRRPEALSPVVYGLSGKLGQEVRIQYHQQFPFEASRFASDPIHALFGVLDLAFIVKIVLSLCMLLFTYDAVCGEKEAGTLRLYASFPVSRPALALAKIVGSSVAVLAPFVIAFLLASVVMALSPELELKGEDWARLFILMGMFGLYLTVFAGFGIWASALTHRRMVAFLVLMGLWMTWIFVVPNVAVDAARRLVSAKSIYEMEKQYGAVREEMKKEKSAEMREFRFEPPAELAKEIRAARQKGSGLSKAQREAVQAKMSTFRNAYMESRSEFRRTVDTKWDEVYFSRLERMQEEQRNRMRQQQRLAMVMSAISPLGAISFASMDLARTGIIQQERIEDALNVHLAYLSGFVREHWPSDSDHSFISAGDLTDFTLFSYEDEETLRDCMYRNLPRILNLVLLAILGFAGAFMAILRYDVR